MPRAPGHPAGIEFGERLLHGDDVFTRHSRAGAAADGKDDAFAARAFQHVKSNLADLLGRAAHSDFEGVHVAQHAPAIADALLDLADVLLLTPIEDVEAGIG